MKLKIFLFLLLVIFLISGVAFAMPQIEEFKTLEEVLRTLPPLPKVEEEESEEQ